MINYVQHVQDYQVNPVKYLGNSLLLKTRELTDETALNLLTRELSKGMPEQETVTWVAKIKQICQKFGIMPKTLPINKHYPGSLSEEQRHNIFTEIFYSIFSDTGLGKIEVVKQ